MRPTDRLFEIIQILRGARSPVIAARLAEQLEVSARTIYRDIAALQSMRIPVAGEAGIGYVLQRGYDLPPINFDIEEAEAISVGLSMLARTGDAGLKRAAERAARKLNAATPLSEALLTSSWGAPDLDLLPEIRAAIREERALQIVYGDDSGSLTRRKVLPVALIYYAEVAVLAAWCRLRKDFRHFRPDRMHECTPLDERFEGEGESLRRAWEASRSADPAANRLAGQRSNSTKTG
ncbi:YafY family protein [uncultured Nisaea sp.]|uniref:helix-turn-helix transcriptional regulator n=1 Tax=uncultured Nisaea sp. TaxID=538215 RepID=UPI0030EBB280|tara:strand:+ start:115 stop:822 length:708 start_codon:yes stop_codon:yes gene_type:complete